jgi:hypothetical protein
MKTIAMLLAATALALGGTAASAEAPGQTRAEKGEARLAKLIEGRVAGEPVTCISAPRSTRLEVIDRVGVVYDAGNTIYVARVDNPSSLRDSDVLLVQRQGSQLCRQDVRTTFDRYNGHTTGVVFLSEFVPYSKRDNG